MRQATARAPSNIALIKYWGKRDSVLNLPATGSISVTLDGLETWTTVRFDEALAGDTVDLEGDEAGRGTPRILGFLDLVRELHGSTPPCAIRTRNTFPTGAGLASSASGFAALALACDAALGLGLDRPALSALARRGSGSAARSFFDGFAEMHAGEAPDGSDAYARALAGPEDVPLAVLVLLTSRAQKGVGSTAGMEHTARTSPYHAAWIDGAPAALAAMREALREADLPRVGALAEASCLRMHADMLAADPALLYWNGTTVELVHAVRALREEGLGVWCTIDAGPQVKVLCAPDDADRAAERLGAMPGVLDVLRSRPGPGARVVEDAAA